MDEKTQNYYAVNSKDVAERYDAVESHMKKILGQAFFAGMRVLDVGAGSGRDVNILLEMGCEAYGIEPCDELREVAVQKRPQLENRICSGQLPQLGQPFEGGFDGVLCSAVLMHLTKAEMLDTAISLRDVLSENGKLLISVPIERDGLDEEHRDAQGRLFTPLSPDYLQLLFERVGFNLLEKWITNDGLGRKGYSWYVLLFQLKHSKGSRPLDMIEGILNRDRKTATYKLALFRALSDIAITEFEQVQWVADGTVGIPISAICEKWLIYYWPLLESPTFIPQIRGEAPGCAMPLAFRTSLSELIQVYRSNGGLTRFVLDFRAHSIAKETVSLFEKVLTQIRNTIIKGPVTYAGGSLEDGPIFRYDSRKQLVLLSSAIWSELSLVGHWIQDAVILRWAELTSDISKRELRPSQIVDLLLTPPIPERDVAEARSTFQKLPSLECAWTGAHLPKKFAVDHIIPFSLWHNNDLWNLVPAAPSINSSKSDKLPSREILRRRQDCIISYWEILRSSYLSRFDHETSRLVGRSNLNGHWQMNVFHAVCDAVEYTAMQRGIERWQP